MSGVLRQVGARDSKKVGPSCFKSGKHNWFGFYFLHTLFEVLLSSLVQRPFSVPFLRPFRAFHRFSHSPLLHANLLCVLIYPLNCEKRDEKGTEGYGKGLNPAVHLDFGRSID
jgi:hypothetical protein